MREDRLRAAGNLVVVLAIGGVLLALSSSDDAPASSPITFVDSTDATAPPALPVASAAGSSEARIVFVGDIMQHEAQRDDDFERSYAKVAPLLGAADIAVGNLEFPVDPSIPIGPLPQTVQFNGSPSHLDALAHAGFTLVSTANNHAFDAGVHGLRSTLRELDQRGLRHVGTARTRAALDRATVILERHGIRIAFFAYTSLLNTYLGDGEDFVDPPANLPLAMVNFGEWEAEYRDQGIARFRADVERARRLGADLVVALTHWGEEWHFDPSDSQRAAAHDLVDSGFDLVVGGHGHVLNRPELYRDKLIVYSLGNFICDFVDWRARTGGMLEATAVRDETGLARFAGFRFRSHLIERPGHVVAPLSGPQDGAESEATLAWRLAERMYGSALTPASAAAPPDVEGH